MSHDPHKAYHQYLLDRMADVLGLDLGLEIDVARLTRAGYEQAVQRCAECPDPQGCEIWLDEFARGAKEPPRMCRNRDMLNHLRDTDS